MMDSDTKKLFKAAKRNRLEEVVSLIEEKGISSSAVNGRGRTIGHIAVRNANFDILKYVVQKDPSILRVEDENLYNIFHLAVKRGALNMVKYLVEEYSEDIFQRFIPDFNDTGTALHRAVKFGYLDMVKYFIDERHVNVNGCVGDQRQPPLFLAVKYKHSDIVNYLVDERNADLTLKDRNRENILCPAVRNGDLNLVKHLLDEKKMDTNKWKDRTNILAVEEAIRSYHSNKEILRYLLEQKNATLNLRYDLELVFQDAHPTLVDEPMVELLVEHGATFSALTEIDKNLLRHINSTFLCRLIRNHQLDIDGEILFQAIEADRYEISVCLMEAGRAIWKDYPWPLFEAFRLGRIDLIKYLVRRMKIDLDTADERGNTALHHYSKDDDNLHACQLLVSYGADVNRQNKKGDTALHVAVRNCQKENCKFLLKHGADIGIRNNNSLDPVQEGLRYSLSESIKNLLRESAKSKNLLQESAKSNRSRRNAVDYFASAALPLRRTLDSSENELPPVTSIGDLHHQDYIGDGSSTLSFQLQNWFLFTQLLFQNVMNGVFSRESIIFSSVPRASLFGQLDPIAEEAVGTLPVFKVRK